MYAPGDKAVVEAQGATVEVVSVDADDPHRVVVLRDGQRFHLHELQLHRERVPNSVDEPTWWEVEVQQRQQRPHIDLDVRRRLGEVLAERFLGAMEWNGHWCNGAGWVDGRWWSPLEKRNSELMVDLRLGYGLDVTQEQAEALLRGEPLPSFVRAAFFPHHLHCTYCDIGLDVHWETNGDVFRLNRPCPNPTGDLIAEVDINCPSGKFLVADDLRVFCRLPCGHHNINKAIGQRLESLMYARAGMAYGGVGNSCPSVHKAKGKDHYKIGCGLRGTRLAGICTDLWAFSILDYDIAKGRAEAWGLPFKKILKTVQVMDVTPGVYRFRYNAGADRDSSSVTFAEFHRIGSPRVEEDSWLKQVAAFQVTAGQALQLQCANWPDLYGTDPVAGALHIADSLFRGCVPERDWHPNGFRNDWVPGDEVGVEDVEVPRFRCLGLAASSISRSVIQTAATGKDELFGGDCPLNPSWAQMAFNLLESAISFGVIPGLNTSTGKYHVAEARKLLHGACDTYYQLLERYPEGVSHMPEFAAWMNDREAVKSWVANFNLGPDQPKPRPPPG